MNSRLDKLRCARSPTTCLVGKTARPIRQHHPPGATPTPRWLRRRQRSTTTACKTCRPAGSQRQCVVRTSPAMAICHHTRSRAPRLWRGSPPVLTRTSMMGPPYCTHRLRVPASCVLCIPEAQGSLLPGRHALYGTDARRPRSKPRPVWLASAARAADWPRLAGAWSSLRRDPALREASGEPVCRSLRRLVIVTGSTSFSRASALTPTLT
eukprot:scaffold7608_cov62-Phaeocystis_antarctica.AAC.7